ncbi:MAG: hypothetical protein FWH20_02365 [Oscillospiraceae bacterium]|nr:hypothetical protein [Oscillospiraceae bacterium]
MKLRKILAVIAVAAMLVSAMAITASAYTMPDFSEITNVTYWYTDFTDLDEEVDQPWPLSSETLRQATGLIIEFSEEPEDELEFISFGEGNDWGWTQTMVFGPDRGLTCTINFADIPGWDDVVSGSSIKIGLGWGDLSSIITSATLIMGGESAPEPAPEAVTAPVVTDAPVNNALPVDDKGVDAGAAGVATVAGIAIVAAAGIVVVSKKKK